MAKRPPLSTGTVKSKRFAFTLDKMTSRSTPGDFTGYHCCRHSEVRKIVQGLEEGMELFIPHRQSA